MCCGRGIKVYHLGSIEAVRPSLLDAGAHAVEALVAAQGRLLLTAGPAPAIVARPPPGPPHALDVAVAGVVGVAHTPVHALVLPLLPLLLDLAKQQSVVQGRALLRQTLGALHPRQSLVL